MPGRTRFERRIVARGTACAVLAGLSALAAGACAPAEPTGPCTGLAERRLGITAAEYGPCASHLLALLDEVRPRVRLVVLQQPEDPEQALADARRTLAELQESFRQTGCERDFRSLRPGVQTERFPNTHVRAFNEHVFEAIFQYRTALQAQSAGNLERAEISHRFARSVHALFR